MSSATAYGQQGPTSNRTGRAAQAKLELHSVDLATWNDGDWADPWYAEERPDDLDEPWPYRFKSGQGVWICASNGEWYLGTVVGQAKRGMTKSVEGLFWCAEFRMGQNRVRKWFAPLNGDIKPDIPHTHRLLAESGWIEYYDSDGSDQEMNP